MQCHSCDFPAPNERCRRNPNEVIFYKITDLRSSKHPCLEPHGKVEGMSTSKAAKEMWHGNPGVIVSWTGGNSQSGHYLDKCWHLKLDSGIENSPVSMLSFLALTVTRWLCKKSSSVIGNTHLDYPCKSWTDTAPERGCKCACTWISSPLDWGPESLLPAPCPYLGLPGWARILWASTSISVQGETNFLQPVLLHVSPRDSPKIKVGIGLKVQEERADPAWREGTESPRGQGWGTRRACVYTAWWNEVRSQDRARPQLLLTCAAAVILRAQCTSSTLSPQTHTRALQTTAEILQRTLY